MRKPRDYDAELAALSSKAKDLKARKQSQLGELVLATGADALSPEELAGALLAAARTSDPTTKEAWRRSGAAMFSRPGANARRRAGGKPGSAAPDPNSPPSPSSPQGAA